MGSASTIRLTDGAAKIKQYGATVVDGSTGAAADCASAAKVGGANLTALTTPDSQVSYDYTPPADSVGGKVCV